MPPGSAPAGAVTAVATPPVKANANNAGAKRRLL